MKVMIKRVKKAVSKCLKARKTTEKKIRKEMKETKRQTIGRDREGKIEEAEERKGSDEKLREME